MIHRTPRYAGLLLAFVALLPFGAALGEQPFLTPSDWSLLRETSSGSAPYENLRFLTGLHRVPSSTAFDQAAAFVLEKAQAYGLKLGREPAWAGPHAEAFERAAYVARTCLRRLDFDIKAGDRAHRQLRRGSLNCCARREWIARSTAAAVSIMAHGCRCC